MASNEPFKGWLDLGWSDPEVFSSKPKAPMKKVDKITIARPILWAAKDGVTVVIEGPFPYGFVRSLDAQTVRAASIRNTNTEAGELVARGETTKPRRYAKTLREYIQEVENEWGPVGY